MTPISLIIIASLVSARNFTSKCVNEDKYCLFGGADASGGIVFTLHAVSDGWAAFAVGSSMKGSSAIIGWRNSTGGYTIAHSYSEQRRPVLESPVNITVLPLAVPAPSWATIALSVLVPKEWKQDVIISPSTSYIWAIGSRPPKEIDTPSLDFSFHASKGLIGVVDFSQEATNGTAFTTTSITAQVTTFVLPTI